MAASASRVRSPALWSITSSSKSPPLHARTDRTAWATRSSRSRVQIAAVTLKAGSIAFAATRAQISTRQAGDGARKLQGARLGNSRPYDDIATLDRRTSTCQPAPRLRYPLGGSMRVDAPRGEGG